MISGVLCARKPKILDRQQNFLSPLIGLPDCLCVLCISEHFGTHLLLTNTGCPLLEKCWKTWKGWKNAHFRKNAGKAGI